jgi:adenosylcobinamide-GDP ribazoletransferase
MKPLLAALQFLTVIPVRGRLTDGDFERAPVWFPLAGLVVGGLAALADLALGRLGCSPALRSILAVALLALLSGGLHLDGLADTADGLFSARPREQALQIMRDSRIGTMGVLALLFVLAVKTAALAQITGGSRANALILAPLAGRCAQAAAMGCLPYARQEGGLAAVFLRRSPRIAAVWAALWLAVAAPALAGMATGALVLASVAGAVAAMSLWVWRRIGGFTGDTLGATSEVVEATILLAVCLR